MGGAFWGMLFGLLFFMPFLGIEISAGLGALFGKGAKTASTSRSSSRCTTRAAGKAGWSLVIDQMTEDKFLAAIEGTTPGWSAPTSRKSRTRSRAGLRRQEAQEGDETA